MSLARGIWGRSRVFDFARRASGEWRLERLPQVRARPGRHVAGIAVEADVLPRGPPVNLGEIGLEHPVALLDGGMLGEMGRDELAHLAQNFVLVDPGEPP